MSGGHFDYKQYEIDTIADSIQSELDKQGKEIPKENLYMSKDYYLEHPEEKYYPTYPDWIQAKFKEAIKTLRLSAIYAQRIDWFLSGDDGEDSFYRRLIEDINKLSDE